MSVRNPPTNRKRAHEVAFGVIRGLLSSWLNPSPAALENSPEHPSALENDLSEESNHDHSNAQAFYETENRYVLPEGGDHL